MKHTIRILVLALFATALNVQADWRENALEGLEWREIGPYRGGRSAAVTGVPSSTQPWTRRSNSANMVCR